MVNSDNALSYTKIIKDYSSGLQWNHLYLFFVALGEKKTPNITFDFIEKILAD